MPAEEIVEKLNNHVHGTVRLFGVDVWITDSMISMWIAMAIVIAFSLIVRLNMRKWQTRPLGFQGIVEALVEWFDGYAMSIMGKEMRFLGTWFFVVFILIIVMDLSGFWLRRLPTADIAITAGLGTASFVLIHVFGIIKSGKHYFKEYAEPSIVMLPIHLIGELATPISLSFRLFGANLGAFIIMELYYSLMPVWLRFGIPAVLHGYFDLFAGSLQAFIFVTLSMTFIGAKVPQQGDAAH